MKKGGEREGASEGWGRREGGSEGRREGRREGGWDSISYLYPYGLGLKCYYRPTASLQLNNKRNTKYNITVT